MVSQDERRSATITAILDAARRQFAARGFAETSVDAIALDAGVAKGAIYHHFSSKEAILDRLVDTMQAEFAIDVLAAARGGRDMLDGIGRGTLQYLTTVTAPDVRRILLVDGPAVLGWERWRAIDHAHFLSLLREPLQYGLQGRLEDRQIEAIGHLVAGAMMEAALVCAAAQDTGGAAHDLTEGLRLLLEPLLR